MVLQKPQSYPLSLSQKASVYYHNIFNYPLAKDELYKWSVSLKYVSILHSPLFIQNKSGYFFVSGRHELIQIRLQNEKYSQKKLNIAKKASLVLKKIPTIKFVGLTGSLAMKNAKKNSDIDLMIVTQKGTLWATRLIAFLLLLIKNFKLRRFNVKDEKDKLCINIWLDEDDLIWEKKNIFTAHELAQIIPLVNKNKIYEKLLYKNKWILNFWPNSVKIPARLSYEVAGGKKWTLLENLAFKLQYLYMKSKITNETVTPTRALFHPANWSNKVASKLNSGLKNNP